MGRFVGRVTELGQVEARKDSVWNFSPGFTQVFKRDMIVIDEVCEGRLSWLSQDAHDTVFFFLASHVGRVHFIDEELAKYRQHSSNVFGWSGRSSIRRLLRRLLDDRATQFSKLEQRARARSTLLAMLEGSLSARLAFGPRMQPSDHKSYDKLAKYYQLRNKVYSSRRICSRLRHWLELISSGAYSYLSPISFDRKAALSDFITGVLLSRLLNPFSKSPSEDDLSCRRRQIQSSGFYLSKTS